jgi:hypothetical protein
MDENQARRLVLTENPMSRVTKASARGNDENQNDERRGNYNAHAHKRDSNYDSGNPVCPAGSADRSDRRWRDFLPQPGREGGGIEAHGAADIE